MEASRRISPRSVLRAALLAAAALLPGVCAPAALAIGAPQALTAASPTNAKPLLSWSVPTDTGNGVSGYVVYRGATRLTTFPITATTYTDATATANSTLTYTVTAVDTGTGLEGAASSAAIVVYDTTAPAAASALVAAATPTAAKPAISWSHPGTDNLAGLAGFHLYRAGSLVGTVPASTRTWTDTALAASGSLAYTVKAFDLAGNEASGPSTTIVYDTLVPGAPATFAPPAAQRVFPVLTWGAATDSGGAGIDHYDILRAGTSIGASTTTSFTDATVPGEGTYSYQVRAVDKAGNVGSPTVARSVVYDTTPPTAPTAPVPGPSPTSAKPLLSWTASTDALSGVSSYKVYRNGLLAGSANGPTFTDSSLTTDGSYAYTVAAVDAAGNESTTVPAATIVFDKTAPPKPTNLAAAATPTGQKPQLSWTSGGTDALSGLARYDVYRGTTLAGSTAGTTFTDTSLSSSGSVSYTVKAVDNAGNASAASSAVAVVYDVQAPPAPSSMTLVAGSSQPPTLSWTAVTDVGGAGLALYRVFRDGALIGTAATTSYTDAAAAPNHQYAYSVTALDRAGNEGPAIGPRSTWYDTGAPTAPTGLAGTSPTSAKPSLSWTASTDAASGIDHYVVLANGVQVGTPTTTSFTWTAASANGWFAFEVQAVDRAGNTSALSSPLTIAYDSAAPTQPTALDAATPTRLAPALTWAAATDALSGVDRYDVYRAATKVGTVPASTLAFTDASVPGGGSYQYTVKAVDLAGNVSAASTAKTVIYDPTPPAAPANLAIPSPSKQPVLTWGAVTDTSGIQRYDVYRDGALVGSATATTWTDTTLSAEGDYVYAVVAVDGAGNASPLSSTRTVVVDLTPPPVPTPLAAVTPTRDKPALAWTSGGADTGSGFKEYHVYRNGTQVGISTTGSYTDTALVVNGTYRYTVTAVDVAGNESVASSEVVVSYDSIGPPAPVALAGATPIAGAPAITWATGGPDNVSGLVGYNVYRAGTKVNASILVATSFTDATVPADGSFAYTVKAVDRAGNESNASAALTIVVDTTPPSGPGHLAAASPTRIQPRLTWTAAGDGAGSGVVRYDVYRDGGIVGTTTGLAYTDDDVLGDGVYAYDVRAIDAAGNVSAAGAGLSVRLDRVAPPAPIGLAGPTPTNLPSLTWSPSTDAGTGGSSIAGYVVYRDGAAAGNVVGTSFTDTGATTSDVYTYTVAAVDGAGNVSAPSVGVDVSFDNVPPPTPTTPTGATVSTSRPALAWTCGCANGQADDLAHYEILRNGVVVGTSGGTSWTDLTLPDNGAFPYAVRAVDIAGNRSATSPARTFTWDTTPPAPPQSLAVPTPTSAPLLTWAPAVDAGGAGVVLYRIRRDGFQIGTTTGTSFRDDGLPDEGAHLYDVVAVDGAGNVSDPSSSAAAFVDRTAPDAPTTLTGATPTPTPTLAWDASLDPGGQASGVAAYRVYRDDVLVATVTAGTGYVDAPPVPQGSRTYVVRAVDRAGNLSAASPARVVLVDTQAPPTPSRLGATENPTPQPPVLTWQSGGPDLVSGFDHYEVLRDGQVVATTTTPGYVDDTLAVQGPHDYRIRAFDAAGNGSGLSPTLTVVYDATPPPAPAGLDIPSPTRLPHLSWVAVSDDDTGASGVVRYRIFRDGAPVGVATTTSFDDGTVPGPGSYGYTVRAVDAAGNEGLASATRTIRYDDQPPEPPTGLTGVTPARQAHLAWQASTDADSGGSDISGYRIYRDGVYLGDSAGVTFLDTTPVDSGGRVYTVRAVDAAGNVSAPSGPAIVVIDQQGPELDAITFPSQALAGIPVTFSVAPHDVDSRVAGSARWEFGQGAAVGNRVRYTFRAPGTYPVVVRARDVLGNQTVVASRAIRVVQPPGGVAPTTLRLSPINTLSLSLLRLAHFRVPLTVTVNTPTLLNVMLLERNVLIYERRYHVGTGANRLSIQLPPRARKADSFEIIVRHAASGRQVARRFRIVK